MTDQGPAPNLAFASSWRRNRLTAAERAARGKEARDRAPRSSHRRLDGSAKDRDPVAMLQAQAESRVPGLVPIRYGRMLSSPFTFYRGAALLMASDLEPSARSGITVQLCGDAHLSNFGLFATPERKLIFDINDFDETLPGPWEWDVKRLAASFEVMGRFRGFAKADRRDVVLESVRAYRERMAVAATRRTLEVWYDHLDATDLLDQIAVAVKRRQLAKRDARAAEAIVRKARTRDSLRVFTKRVGKVDGELRIVADPPLIIPIEEFINEGSADWRVIDVRMKELLSSYRETLGIEHHPLEEFRYVHAAHKIVGVGSVGTRCYILLLIGRDNGDPLILQVKESQPSVLEQFIAPSEYAHHGQRVVAGQRLMQAASDAFLGWQRFTGSDGVERDYYVRQLHDWKGSADPEVLSVRGAVLYARICGATLARAHARWGDRIAIASYLGRSDVFDRAVADFSAAYADRNEQDFEALERAVRTGRIRATRGL